MKKVSVFDFDGTLTLKDSMMAIIVFQRGHLGLLWALLRQIHLITLMFLGKYPNQKTKEHLLSYCFGGMEEKSFELFCQRFADSHQHILNPDMLTRLRKATEEGQMVYVITASPESWVARLIPGVRILGSKMEIVNGKITGRLSNKNCYGPEKVERLLSDCPDIYKNRENYEITAYGDSRGDHEMFKFANHAYLIKQGKCTPL